MASDRLNIDDLKTVRTEVLPAAFKWYDLGVELEISPNTLDTIKKDDPIECLCELIAKWLRGVDPKPTWKALIAALRSTVVGYQSLAEKLESKYCESLRETGTEKDNESHQAMSNGTAMPPNKKRRISEVASKHTDGGRSVKYDGSSYTFVEPFAQNLLCKRCSNFPVDPHQVTCQRLSLFCKSCVQHKELRCDCKSYPDSVSKEQIEKLKVECPNSASGCEWQGQLVAVANHQGSDCQKETVCCPYHDIGCAAEMLREKVKGHESEAREKHLECAMKTIVDMKQTDNIIRKKMTDLENLFHEKLAKQKEEHEMAIQTLKETISQCPPVVVKMTNFDDRSETLCVFDLIHNDKLFMSSNFYSRPREYKLCVVLKCLRKKFIMKLKVAALYQTECSHSWPLKGVAVVTVQPGDQDSLKLSIHFDIRAAPSDPNVDHISKEDGFQEFKIPREWQELAKLIPTPNITLKVETVELSSSSPLSEQLMTCAS